MDLLVDPRTDEDEKMVEMPREPTQAEEQHDDEQHLDDLKVRKKS